MGYYSEVAVTTTKKGLAKIKELLKDDKDATDLVELLEKYRRDDGDNVLLYNTNLKWLGYNFDDKLALEKAFDECGEFVRVVCLGEDGMSEDYDYNEDKMPDDMVYIGTYSGIDFNNWGEL